MLTNVHVGGYAKNGKVVLLALVYACCKLGIPEHVKYSVIAYAVAASEVLMGVVISHTPGETSADILFTCYGIKNIGVSYCMLHSVVLTVKGFSWIHMAVVFRNKIWM